MRTYPPTTAADVRRLKRIIRRDFQASPKPQYPRESVDDMDAELRAQFDAMDAEMQELIRVTMDLLSDVKPRDRLFMLHTLDRCATLKRAEREAAEQQERSEAWDAILNA
jgi:hypothetical protein